MNTVTKVDSVKSFFKDDEQSTKIKEKQWMMQNSWPVVCIGAQHQSERNCSSCTLKLRFYKACLHESSIFGIQQNSREPNHSKACFDKSVMSVHTLVCSFTIR